MTSLKKITSRETVHNLKMPYLARKEVRNAQLPNTFIFVSDFAKEMEEAPILPTTIVKRALGRNCLLKK